MQEKNLKEYIKVTDHLVSGEQFSLLYNPETDMLITTPQPRTEDLSKYYQSEAYISHTDSNKTFTDKLYQWVKKYAISTKFKLINNFIKTPGSLLDIGAGTGDFLEIGALLNWEVQGVETNPSARKLAAKKGVQLEAERSAFDSKKFNVITFWHVLEHVPDYQAYLDWCHAHLEDNGILIIAVPNYKSWDAKHFKEFWAAYDAPRHLWHFSKKSIAKLCDSSFKVVKTKPMIFDAFYVSLLSRKHKTGKSNLVFGFLAGLRSNLSALRTNQYSSQIYVLQKVK